LGKNEEGKNFFWKNPSVFAAKGRPKKHNVV